MPPTASDKNVAFILTPIQRQQIIRLLDRMVEGLPRASSILIDRAGRIVELARKPVGVDLPAISALAAGCFATTHELAEAMGESDYSLIFEHEDEQQVYVWPVAERALLVVLLARAASIEAFEERLSRGLGQEIVKVIKQAREPERGVPAPRVEAPQIPPELREQTRSLTALIMDLQIRRAADFTPRVNAGLLSSREQLVQALSRQDWRLASEICENTRQSLLRYMHLSSRRDAGQVLIRLYSEVLDAIHEALKSQVSEARLEALYKAFFRTFSKKWPQIFLTAKPVLSKGVDVSSLWYEARALVPDSVRMARDFVAAMDTLVREVLRVVYLTKGAEGRQAILEKVTAILEKNKADLLPLGLEGVTGRDWALIPGAN